MKEKEMEELWYRVREQIITYRLGWRDESLDLVEAVEKFDEYLRRKGFVD